LSHISKDQGRFEIYNSPLSEFGVMGFDYGYSMAYPEALVIWEAQFGDFSNGGQTIIDQYLTSGEQKWGRKVSLVLFLPHGYEGQGPDHSSGRIERFLTMSARNNMLVVNPTTPVQFFHLLRRHIIRPFRKPLIIFTPKGLLRHPDCVNRIEEFTSGSFQEILDDPTPPSQVRKLVFTSGHLYYDIAAERTKDKQSQMAIIRIEQLYPLYAEKLSELMKKYSGAEEFVWAQPEPCNMGAWSYIRPLLTQLLPPNKELKYIGRESSPASAVGTYALHKKEQAAIMAALFPNKHEPEIDVSSMQRV
jgi:2-oxoglutarate dehydrogenase E1 component